MNRTFLFLAASLLTAAPAIARAQPAPTPDQPAAAPAAKSDRGAFVAGGKVGGAFSWAGLSPFVVGGIEVGYVLPFLNRSFGILVDLDYTAPSKSGTDPDPRVMSGGKYNWHLTQQELNLMPVVMWRMTFIKARVTPFIGIGPRFFFLKSTVRSGEGTPMFQETTEQSTKVGFGIPLGVEIALGPGGILVEPLIQYGVLDHTSTGASSTGAVNVSVGYRFLL
jgi:opacity protein-like surface antigen